MINENEELWYAIRTKYKSEKKVRDRLIDRGIVAYVPLYTKRKVYKSRTKIVELPLLSTYVFVKIDKSDSLSVLRTFGVSGFLKIAGVIIPIPDDEIEILKRVAGDCEFYEESTNEIIEGDNVEIIGSNLTGMKGKMVSRKNKKYFVVELKTLGQSLMIQVKSKFVLKV